LDIGSVFNQARGPDLIRSVDGFGSESGSMRAKITHKNRESEEISCSEVLDILFCVLKASPAAWTSFMKA
jgi:hypothetical protein